MVQVAFLHAAREGVVMSVPLFSLPYSTADVSCADSGTWVFVEWSIYAQGSIPKMADKADMPLGWDAVPRDEFSAERRTRLG